MRSLIILQVTHSDETDGLQSMYEHLISDTDWYGDGSLLITDHTVKVDLPECFVLEGGVTTEPIDYAAGMSTGEIAQELLDMDAFDAWLDTTDTLPDFYNMVMREAAEA